MTAEGQKVHTMRGSKPSVWYTVYEAPDKLIVIGFGKECAAYMGMSMNCFRSIVSKVKSGRNKAYCIVVEDLEAGTYAVYGGDNTGELRGRPRKVDYDLVADLYYSGMCDADIARKLGINQGTVWEWRTKKGLPPIGKRGRPRKVVA